MGVITGPGLRLLIAGCVVLALPWTTCASGTLGEQSGGDASAGKKANDRSSMSVAGYTHIEYLSNLGAADSFWARRVRLGITGRSRDRLDGKLLIHFDRFQQVDVRDLYVTGYLPDIAARVGQQKVPLSDEILLSSLVREPLERATAPLALWPGSRDIGITTTLNPKAKQGASLTCGIYLGEGPTSLDANPGKDFVLRYTQYFDGGNGRAFVGYQNGSVGLAGAVVPRRYYVGGLTWKDTSDRWRAYGEAYVGTLGTPFVGGFVRGVKCWDGGKNLVYAQLQYWDPDTGAPGRQWGPLVGYSREIGDDTKLTVQYDGDRRQIGARCQVCFD